MGRTCKLKQAKEGEIKLVQSSLEEEEEGDMN